MIQPISCYKLLPVSLGKLKQKKYFQLLFELIIQVNSLFGVTILAPVPVSFSRI